MTIQCAMSKQVEAITGEGDGESQTKSRVQTCRGRTASVEVRKEIMESLKMSLNMGAQTAQHQTSLRSDVSSFPPLFIMAICKIKSTLKTGKKMKKCE